MIYFKLRIANPWFKPLGKTTGHDYYWRDIRLSENKNFEIQISKFQADNLLDIAIDLQWWGRDHAGPELDINMFGYMFNVNIYDSRHWNYDENRWMTGEEARKEEEE